MAIRVSPPGTRGTRIPKPLLKLFKPMGTLVIRRYRRSGGNRVSSRMGFPVVLLTTRGAKTGRTRTTPVGGFPDGENSWLVAASLGGAAHHPAWFFNMAKHPDDIWLEVGKERFKVAQSPLRGPSGPRRWPASRRSRHAMAHTSRTGQGDDQALADSKTPLPATGHGSRRTAWPGRGPGTPPWRCHCR